MYENLVRLNTYAEMKGVSPETVRLWAVGKKIPSVKIDGMRFVILSDEEVKKRKKL